MSAENQSISDAVNGVADTVESLSKRLDGIDEKIEKASQPVFPTGTAPAIIVGERGAPKGFNMAKLACRMRAHNAANPVGDKEIAKYEFDLASRVAKAYPGFSGALAVPLSADLLPTEEVEKADGTTDEPIAKSLVQEVREAFNGGGGIDWDEVHDISKRTGINIAKDLSSNTALTGGTLVAYPAQGELIELLRAQEWMSRVGARQIALPAQGRLRMPRVTSGTTIAGYGEAETVAESTPGTGAAELEAKAYSGLVDFPEELMKFASSVSVDAWLRSELAADMVIQVNTDAINGGGGTEIQGLIHYSGINTRTATTTGANGDTLGTDDPILLHGDLGDANAPVDRGYFMLMTHSLWAGIRTRKASGSGEYMFRATEEVMGNGTTRKLLDGQQVETTSLVPTDRAKGSGTDLTLLLAGVGSELVIGRAGVIDFAVTDSDGTKFQQRLFTIRGTEYCDCVPRHEESFGFIDDLLNS